MSLDQLDGWLDALDPPAKVDGASMLDGYVTAIVVGPSSIPPDEWFVDLLGARGRIATAHGETLAAMTAIVARFNAISETLSTAPTQHAPIFEKTDDGLAHPHPWCMGFLSAMQLRLKAWEPLLDPSRPDHALMLPILLYCIDALGGSYPRAARRRRRHARLHTGRLSRHPDCHSCNPKLLDAAARRRGTPSSLNCCDRLCIGCDAQITALTARSPRARSVSPVCRRLMTVPGVGPLVAMTYTSGPNR